MANSLCILYIKIIDNVTCSNIFGGFLECCRASSPVHAHHMLDLALLHSRYVLMNGNSLNPAHKYWLLHLKKENGIF